MPRRCRNSRPDVRERVSNLRCVEDVSVDHLGVYGHQRPQVDVDAMRVQTHQRQDVEEELGPQSQILHDEGEGQHLGRLVPDERLLGLSVHQLRSRSRDKRENINSLQEILSLNNLLRKLFNYCQIIGHFHSATVFLLQYYTRFVTEALILSLKHNKKTSFATENQETNQHLL